MVTLFDQGGVNFSWSDPLNFSPRSLFKILASHFKDLRLSLFQGLVKTFHHRRDFSLALFSTIRFTFSTIRFTFYQSSISRLIFTGRSTPTPPFKSSRSGTHTPSYSLTKTLYKKHPTPTSLPLPLPTKYSQKTL